MNDWDILLSIIMMIVVLILAYLTTVFLASRFSMSSKGKHLRIVDQLVLDKDKRLLVVQIANRYHILAFSGNHVENLGIIEDLPSIEAPGFNHDNSFGKILTSKLSQWRNRDE